jgi:hypothetical protein
LISEEKVREIIKNLKDNMDFFIPNANQSEQNYYLRGAIDALMSLGENQ